MSLHGNQEHCPNCGKFLEYDADGFYDREHPYTETSRLVQFCNEDCADRKREKDASRS